MVLQLVRDPFSLAVLGIVAVMVGVSAGWWVAGRRQATRMEGALAMLHGVAHRLPEDHPIRKRLESTSIADLSLEEIARLMRGHGSEAAASALLLLHARIGWVERFAQLAIHLGILGTVFALVTSDPSDLEGFRARLPVALGTTFWGLVGAIALSALAGGCQSVLERAQRAIRGALLAGFDR